MPSSSDSMKVYVGSIPFTIDENDLRPIFEAFGPIDHIDIHKDAQTGQSKGFGFVQFSRSADAKMALSALDGFEIAGRAIRVGNATENKVSTTLNSFAQFPTAQKVDLPVARLEEESLYGGMNLTASGRAQLMQKLQRSEPSSTTTTTSAPAGMVNVSLTSVSNFQQPTSCLLLTNMFNPTEEEGDDWDLDVRDDVQEEAAKMGQVKHLFVDKTSKGNVWIRMGTIDAAIQVQRVMHGRWFASRQISAEFVPDAQYIAMYPQAK
jgi:RNA-binding protein 39